MVFGQDPRANCHQWHALHQAALNDLILIDDLCIDPINTSTHVSGEKVIPPTSVTLEFKSSTGLEETPIGNAVLIQALMNVVTFSSQHHL
jgi:hypothetical protein